MLIREVGTRIRRLRDSKRWAQRELAKRAKVSLSTIQRIEFGSDRIAYGTLFKIADALGVSVDYLKTGKEPKAPEWQELEEAIDRLMKRISKKESLQVLVEDGHATAKEVAIFLNSEDIPKDVRETILETIKSSLKRYVDKSE